MKVSAPFFYLSFPRMALAWKVLYLAACMKLPFKIRGRNFWIFLVLALITAGRPVAAWGEDRCAVCGEEIQGEIYLMKDELTGQTEMVCSNCMMTLPRCYICGLPIKKGEELELPD